MDSNTQFLKSFLLLKNFCPEIHLITIGSKCICYYQLKSTRIYFRVAGQTYTAFILNNLESKKCKTVIQVSKRQTYAHCILFDFVFTFLFPNKCNNFLTFHHYYPVYFGSNKNIVFRIQYYNQFDTLTKRYLN